MYATLTRTNRPVTATHWNGSSWSNGIPNSINDVYIDADYDTTSGSFSCRNLHITANAKVTIVPETYVKILKDIHQSATSRIHVKSGGNLMIMHPNADVTSAKVIAERTFKNVQRLDYVFMASPISGIPLKRLSPGTVDSRFYTYNEIGNYLEAINPTTTIIEQGKGFQVRVPSLHSSLPTNFDAIIENLNGEFINSGVINSYLSNSNYGFNIVGNPYLSTISLRKFFELNKGKINLVVNFWQKQMVHKENLM